MPILYYSVLYTGCCSARSVVTEREGGALCAQGDGDRMPGRAHAWMGRGHARRVAATVNKKKFKEKFIQEQRAS